MAPAEISASWYLRLTQQRLGPALDVGGHVLAAHELRVGDARHHLADERDRFLSHRVRVANVRLHHRHERLRGALKIRFNPP